MSTESELLESTTYPFVPKTVLPSQHLPTTAPAPNQEEDPWSPVLLKDATIGAPGIATSNKKLRTGFLALLLVTRSY